MDQPLPPIPRPEAERQVCNSQSQKARGNLDPRYCIFHQTVSRLPVANLFFLESSLPGGSQPEISSPEETHGTPEMVLLWYTWESKQLGPGR